MQPELKEWFYLKDRDSFIIDPEVNVGDGNFYFGRIKEKEQVEKQIRHSFISPGIPKIYLLGDYGSGKTQMLYYLKNRLINDPPSTLRVKPRLVMMNIQMNSKSDHRDFHLQLMESLSKQVVTNWVSSITRQGLVLENELEKIFHNSNTVEALIKLTIGGIEYTAWRWLSGQQLSTKELEQLKVTRNLGEVGAGDMVEELTGIGHLAALMDEKLIFLIDEAERFLNVSNADALDFLEDYFRILAGNANSSVGFVVAGTARGMDDAARFLVTGSVIDRIGKQNVILIPPIPTLDDVKSFVKQMLVHIIDQPKAEETIKNKKLGIPIEIFPFNADSFDSFCENACQDIVRALPRNIINGINECAIAAWDKNQPIVDSITVNEIAPLIFE